MGFKVSESELLVVNTIKDIEEYAKEEKKRIKFIPVEEYIRNDAMFMDDEFYGRGKNWVSFNHEGFTSFCNTFNIPQGFLKSLEEENLASRTLNDYFQQKCNKENLMKYQFVLDSATNTVVGLVSKTYQKYYNESLLDDLKNYFSDVYNKFEVSESYIYNTNLYLRLLSPKIKAGVIKRWNDSSDDISRVGLQISNSLVGDSSVKINFFVLRLICSNGLIIQSLNTSGKVVHSGREDTFSKRLGNAISPILKDLKTIPNMINTLCNIEYKPVSIVEANGASEVYNLIPLNGSDAARRKNLKGEKLKAFDIEVISEYPYRFGGQYSKAVFESHFRSNQNMFDFINVFTEYAHSNDVDFNKRIEIEQRTGQFVSWVIKNKSKLEKFNKQTSDYIDIYSLT